MARHTIEIADSQTRELEDMARREGISPRTLLVNMLRIGWRQERERLTLLAAAAQQKTAEVA